MATGSVLWHGHANARPKAPTAMLRRSLFPLLLLLLARCGATPTIDCNLKMVAQMPLQVEDHLLVVPVGVDGKWVHLIVDSGAERTMLSETAAERLGLPHDMKHVSRTGGIGGAIITTATPNERL